jgi:hypothetical protein
LLLEQLSSLMATQEAESCDLLVESQKKLVDDADDQLLRDAKEAARQVVAYEFLIKKLGEMQNEGYQFFTVQIQPNPTATEAVVDAGEQ